MRILRTTCVSFLIVLCGSVHAQKEYKHLNKGDKAFYNYEFKKALKHYLKVLETDSNTHVLRSIGQSYAYLKDMKTASKYFKSLAQREDALPLDYLEYAQCLKRLGDYELAVQWFEKYRAIYPLDLRARNHAVNTYHYQKLSRNKKNPLFFSLEVNDEEAILGVTKYKDGVIFCMTDNNGSSDFMDVPEVFLDLFSANLSKENEFEKIRYLPFNINTNLNDGPASYNEKISSLAFSRNAIITRENRTNAVRLQIFFAAEDDGKWSDPEPFIHNNDNYSVGHPAYSVDGSKLFFVSDMPGGFGGTDIYMCKKGRDGEWLEPKNLGPDVNTESDEVFPFAAEGDVLYFSTEGHAGLGGLDLFRSYPFEDYWSKPENMGAPMNSRYDDFGFVQMSESQAFFVSDRLGGEGQEDIYFIDIEASKQFFTIPSKLIENDNLSPISVVNLKTGEEEFIKMGESSHLSLDVSENGYQVSWLFQGEEKQIIVSGEKTKEGELDVEFTGLDGLELNDFVSEVIMLGKETPQEIKINQKVWTYEPPDSDGFLSDVLLDAPDYAAGKDNVIFLDEDGNEIPNETYPKSEYNTGKEIFYLNEETAENINSFEKQLDAFVKEYSETDKPYVSIKLIKTDKMSPLMLEQFGEQVEQYITEKGIPEEKIQLEWIDESTLVRTEDFSSDFEIYITADTNFSFVH